jgi:DNA-binding MarR family transcriptional regulator
MDHIEKIITATFEMGRAMRQRMTAHGRAGDHVNFLQIHALFIIDGHNGMTMKEFAGALMITSPSATSLVNRLVKLQWVVRSTDPSNRKQVHINVTAVGRKVMREAMKKKSKEMRQVFALLSAKDQKELARILTTLHSHILTH